MVAKSRIKAYVADGDEGHFGAYAVGSNQYGILDTTDILGKRFGGLVVISFLRKERNQKRNAYIYACQCDCGGFSEIERNRLCSKRATSCGCRAILHGSDKPNWTGHGDISGRYWRRILQNAKRRGIPINLTIAEAWSQFQKQQGRCALSGLHLILTTGSTMEATASLDRIDSNLGYTLCNIQWIHKSLNQMKSDLSQERFLELCRAITLHAGEGTP